MKIKIYSGANLPAQAMILALISSKYIPYIEKL
jgi:hypothetical protein